MNNLPTQLAFSTFFFLLLNSLLVNAEVDIFSMDLGQLSDIKVVSVSKKSQSLLQAAAAIHIISQDDIRRSGATSLPEVLRGAPGVQVAQVDGNKWAVSIRGFNDRFANKLLVMVDGRSVYSPLFSRVFWNMQDMILEDIDRIEIIRGPGGTIWGANAVNGVINIITKNSAETQGSMISFTGGSLERNISARYGGKINDQISFRLYAKGKHTDDYNTTKQHQAHIHDSGGALQHQANDQWRNFTTGFRVDGDLNDRNQWMLQGGYTVGTANQLAITDFINRNAVKGTIDTQTGNILFRWDNQQTENNKWRFQAYYDRFKRRSLGSTNEVNTLDLEIQNQLQPIENHAVIWGLGYRGIFDSLQPGEVFSFNPQQRYTNTFSVFIQDEIQLTETVRFTLGSKVEHNSYTGFEFQPNTRLLWEVNDKNSIWGAASRAVRIPSRSESDLQVNHQTIPSRNPFAPPTLIQAADNRNLKSEEVYALELGYRSQLTDTFTLDTALFYNYYERLVNFDLRVADIARQPEEHDSLATHSSNELTASTYGAEVIGKWQVTNFWQLTSSYSWFKLNAHLKTPHLTDIVFTQENSDPRHQFSVRSNIQLPYNLEFNSLFYYTDRLQAHNVQDQARLDLRLAWSPTSMLELSVVAQNITNKQHQEFTAQDIQQSYIPRSAYGRITFRF